MSNDIYNTIKNCIHCNKANKFKVLKGNIKIIIENGPHYHYVTDIWHLTKKIRKKNGFKYLLDIVDHFTK